ncbi:MAG TPA: DUF4397 domain-containing protein [Daejeonella sp.]
MTTIRIPGLPLVRTIFITILVFFLGSIIAACQKLDQDQPQELLSAVNVVNASIGMNPVGFFIGGSKVQGAPLHYTGESGYFITFPGEKTFDAIEDTAPDYFLKTSVTFKQNTYHTIFIAGEPGSITTLFTEDDLTAPPAGKAKIRFVQLSPDGGSLILSLKNGTVLFPEQGYKTASAFKTLDPGVYDLQLKTATGELLAEQNVTINAGIMYTAWVKGLRSNVSNSPIGLQLRSIN